MRHALCWTAVLLLCGTAVRAEDEYEDAFGLLAKLQEDLGSKLSRIPDYVCNADIVETVSSVNPSHVVRRSQARVQAGLIQGEELFSWAEESHFRRYEELQRGYPGIVSYSRLLPTLLDSDNALFEYAGRELSEGSSLMRFTVQAAELAGASPGYCSEGRPDRRLNCGSVHRKRDRSRVLRRPVPRVVYLLPGRGRHQVRRRQTRCGLAAASALGAF